MNLTSFKTMGQTSVWTCSWVNLSLVMVINWIESDLEFWATKPRTHSVTKESYSSTEIKDVFLQIWYGGECRFDLSLHKYFCSVLYGTLTSNLEQNLRRSVSLLFFHWFMVRCNTERSSRLLIHRLYTWIRIKEIKELLIKKRKYIAFVILSKLMKNRKRITHLLLFRQSNHNRYTVTTTMKYTVLIAMSIIHFSILLVVVVVIHISYVGEPTFIVVLGWWEFRDVNFVCGGGILMNTILLMWDN